MNSLCQVWFVSSIEHKACTLPYFALAVVANGWSVYPFQSRSISTQIEHVPVIRIQTDFLPQTLRKVRRWQKVPPNCYQLSLIFIFLCHSKSHFRLVLSSSNIFGCQISGKKSFEASEWASSVSRLPLLRGSTTCMYAKDGWRCLIFWTR